MNTQVAPFSWQQRLSAYIALTRFNRPIGTWLLMWPMLWALWFAADGEPDIRVLIIFVIGTFLTRSAGCAINDFADRHFDAHVERTRNRPLASGQIHAWEAVAVFVVLMLCAFMLVMLTNRTTVLLSLVAVALAFVYPFTKRFTYFPQLFLGAAFSWAIPMVYTAQTGGVNLVCWIIFLASVLWALAYDTMYAMADRDDDLLIGIKSTAIYFGKHDVLITSITQCLVLAAVAVAGWLSGRGLLFYSSLTIAATLVIYQLGLLKTRSPDKCIRAFLNNNYVGMVIFLGILLDYAVEQYVLAGLS